MGEAKVITVTLSIVLLVLTFPLFIGAAAFAEEKGIGTHFIADACRVVGLFEPLRQLAEFFGARWAAPESGG